MKIIIFFILTMCLMPMVYGYTVVQYSLDNVTWENATITNENEVVLEELDDGINENTDYYFRLQHIYDNGNSSWVYVYSKSDTSGELSMSSIAVLGLMVLITVSVFKLPEWVGKFSNYDYVNTLFSGLIYTLGLFLTTLCITMAYSYSVTFNLGVENIVFRFMWLILWTGYISMGAVILLFGYKGLMEWNIHRKERKYGVNEKNEA